MKKYTPWILIIGVILGAVFWVYRGITKPLPGEAVPDQGAEHLTDISGIEYNSNPPTSGPHFPVWAKPGIYDRFISDGYLIHSMEHGYIIIWYSCGSVPLSTQEASESAKPLTKMTVLPTQTSSWTTPGTQPEVEVEFPESFTNDPCKSLVNELSAFTKIAPRVIVAPRMNMDTQVALTAWNRILKLQSVDKGAIENFINTFHNRGPEQTME